jgi:hypothetical protein
MPLNLQSLGASQGHDAEQSDNRSCAGSRPDRGGMDVMRIN